MLSKYNDLDMGELKNIIELISPHVETNSEPLIFQLLACFSNCIGMSAYFNVGADIHYTNLFVAIVGKSARGGKGSSLNIIKNLFKDVDSVWYKDRIDKGLSSGEGIISRLKDQIDDNTINLNINSETLLNKRLLITESEFSSVLKMGQREGNTLSQIIRDCWDCVTLGIITKNDPMRAENPFVSIIGHITEVELLRYLDKYETGNGFGNRFIFVKAERIKSLPNPKPLADEAYAYITNYLKVAINGARACKQVNFNLEAEKLWESWYEQYTKDDSSIVGSLTSRQAPQVRRLAMNIALINGLKVIDLNSLMLADRLFKYSIETLRGIYGNSMGDPLTDKVYDLLKSSPNGLSRSQLSDSLSRNYQKGTLDNSLNRLKSQDLIDFNIQATLGRPIETWFVKV